MFTTYLLPAEVQMIPVMKCHQPTRIAVERANGLARIRSVARTVSSRRRICGRAMELVNGYGSFLALSNRRALSILDASFKFAWASYLVAGEPWSTVRMEHRKE